MTAEPGSFDPYKTLQVDPEAEDEVIEAAYRRLARKYHPDVAPGPEAQSRMIALNRAWEMLRDPHRRAQVDRARASAGMRAAPRTPEPSPASPPKQPAWRARQAEAAPPRPPSSPPPGQAPRPTSPGAGAPSAGSGRPTDGGDPAWQDQVGFDAFTDAIRREGGQQPRPEQVSQDWTAGRAFSGGGYDPSMRTADGHGAAGPPPGKPSGSVLGFGRYAGWSLGEIARTDLEYLEWLERMPIGRAYTDEIDVLLRKAGRRQSAEADKRDGRGLYRR